MRAGGRGPDIRTRDRGPDNPNTRCFEHIAGGVNIYLYVSISLLVCVCVCVSLCMCVCAVHVLFVFGISNQSINNTLNL